MKRLIFGMAKSKKDTFSKLESKTPELMDTLIKLYLYPDHESKLHWRQEVSSFINMVPKLKGSNAFPKSEDIIKNTWKVWSDCLLDWIDPIMEDYGYSDKSSNKKELYDNCKSYFEWLGKELSSRGKLSNKSIYEKLESLGF